MMILHQVNRFSTIRMRNNFLRFIHNEIVPPLEAPPAKTQKVLYPLTKKRLLRISGSDAPEFLQGLMTNDMRHFEDGANSIYAMFLNNKGRVLFDTLIHKWKGSDSFLIECDKTVIGQLERHLKIFKLKRRVDIEDINHLYKMWVLIAPPDSVPELKLDPESSVNIYKDPRLTDLGFRVLLASFLTVQQISETIGQNVLIPENEDGYTYLRYKLGVSEGAEDLPPAKRLPLEANCDYLHGVSFHKGCYIGQELLARVYFTGVIRKRIMPIAFADEKTSHLEKDSDIVAVNNHKLNYGKLVGASFDHGIGVLKIKEALEARNLMVHDCCGEVVHPSWWPIEAPKDTATLRKPIETL